MTGREYLIAHLIQVIGGTSISRGSSMSPLAFGASFDELSRLIGVSRSELHRMKERGLLHNTRVDPRPYTECRWTLSWHAERVLAGEAEDDIDRGGPKQLAMPGV